MKPTETAYYTIYNLCFDFTAVILLCGPPPQEGAAYCIALCLSVCPSVPLSIASRRATQRITMTHMYFSARAEGRISYGHLGRTDSCSIRNGNCSAQIFFKHIKLITYKIKYFTRAIDSKQFGKLPQNSIDLSLAISPALTYDFVQQLFKTSAGLSDISQNSLRCKLKCFKHGSKRFKITVYSQRDASIFYEFVHVIGLVNIYSS